LITEIPPSSLHSKYVYKSGRKSRVYENIGCDNIRNRRIRGVNYLIRNIVEGYFFKLVSIHKKSLCKQRVNTRAVSESASSVLERVYYGVYKCVVCLP
jgi:hypothetical protein